MCAIWTRWSGFAAGRCGVARISAKEAYSTSTGSINPHPVEPTLGRQGFLRNANSPRHRRWLSCRIRRSLTVSPYGRSRDARCSRSRRYRGVKIPSMTRSARWRGDSGHPALRPSGPPAAVQNRSERSCIPARRCGGAGGPTREARAVVPVYQPAGNLEKAPVARAGRQRPVSVEDAIPRWLDARHLRTLDFIARLTALVPKPRINLTCFHGAFAPNSKHRARVTPAKRGRGGQQARPADSGEPTPTERRAAVSLKNSA